MSISVSSHFKYYLENNHSDGNRPNLTKFCKKFESSSRHLSPLFRSSIFSFNHSFDLSILFSSRLVSPLFLCMFGYLLNRFSQWLHYISLFLSQFFSRLVFFSLFALSFKLTSILTIKLISPTSFSPLSRILSFHTLFS